MHLQTRSFFLPIVNAFFLCVALLFLASCAEVEKPAESPEKKVYKTSFLWDSTEEILVKTDIRISLEEKLEEAKANFSDDSTDLNSIIWYGRRLAYLHYYEEAIRVFSDGLKRYPEAPELYRHRGHRLITLRRFEDAVKDLELATQLASDKSFEIEPDGLPNKLNIPLSNLHFNIYYHLGLAYYLTSDYSRSLNEWSACLAFCTNDDLLAATTYWMVLSHLRMGESSKADSLLTTINPNMEIIENHDYLNQLLIFQGLKPVHQDINPRISSEINPTELYGLSVWEESKGNLEESAKIRKQILSANNWAYFGYIAAESDSLYILNK